MVDDFSQFAQLPSPRFEVCNLVTCVKRTIDLAEGTYAPHTVRFEGPENSFEAEIDEQLIRQALHNLIKNAAEADSGSSTPITLRILENQSHLLMEIEDEGPGIPDELRKSIFEAYVTTKHTGPTPGMGLGLAICQKIVLEHNGKITVDSRPGRTVFRISIPRYRKGVRI
jgi:nitrogen fixation/metabolism regulation signal transduction histidine kinase